MTYIERERVRERERAVRERWIDGEREPERTTVR